MSVAPEIFTQLLQASGVNCSRVLNAMNGVDRTGFVEPALHAHAWSDQTLPIGNGQTISLPSIVGKMTQAIDLQPSDKILEIGTGCGYQTSVLSPLCRQIYTVERHPTLSKLAKQRFNRMRLYNIIPTVDDGEIGFKNQAPFDKIIVTCSAIDIPTDLVNQLKIDGIIVVPVGEDGEEQNLLKIIRTENGMDIEDLGVVNFVPMLEGIGN